MKKITLFLFALFSCWQISAQVNSYSFSTGTTGTMEPMSGSIQLIGSGSDDTASAVRGIGFTFNYAGTDYTQFSVNTNGLVRLGAAAVTTAFTNSAANANTNTPAIFPYWDDVATGSAAGGGNVSYVVTGSAPNRKLVIEWFVTIPRNTTGAANGRFQCVLEETTNIITFNYGTGVVTATNGYSIGLATATATFNNVNVTTNTNTTTTFITTNTLAIPSGTFYRFTPPVPCSGTPVAGTVAPATQTLLSGQASAALTVTGQTSGVSGLTYQWEQSTDGTNWVNAVGGTGATTLTYTPPVFGGSMIMYRLRITCTVSAETSVSTVATLNPCGVYAVPSLEDFTTFMPSCWQRGDNGDLVAGPATFGTSSWLADGFGNVGTTGATKINLDATGDNDWILSPLYSIPATGYELKFFAAATQWNATTSLTTAWEADDFVQVLVSSGTTNWTVLYTYDNTNVPSNTGTPNVIDLDAYAGQSVRFAFRGVEGATDGSADIDFFIDNFEVRLTPPCVEPTTLTATSITSNGANLSWVDPSGIQFDYELVVQLAGGGVPTVAGDIVDITTLPLTINTLNPNTNYEFWVRANCGVDGNSAWVGPVTFRTLCAVFVAPFNQPFATNTFPSCWSQSGPTPWEFGSNVSTPAGFADYGADLVPDFNGAGGTFIGMDGSDNTNGEVSSLLTPFIDVTSLTTPRLKYAVFGNNVNDAARNLLQVEVWNGTTWNLVNTVSDNLGPNWVVFTTNLSSLTITGPIQIRFTVTGVANGGSTFYHDILIDDVTVEETPVTPPSCASNVVAPPHPTCGNFNNTISWDAVSGADGYNLTIGTTSGGNDVLNNQNLGSSISYVFAGTVNTTYYYTVTPYNANGSAVGCIERTFTTNTNGCYCSSNPTSNDASGITNVQVGTTNFPTGDVTYFDHSATTVDLARGVTSNVQVIFATGYTYNTNIWIDFDNDFTFEASELVFQGESTATNPTTLNASFLMPAGAPLGLHKMRIGTADSGQATPNPCYSGSYGVTLDFNVNVVAPSCVPPAATASVVYDCVNSQYSVNVNVTNLGNGSPVITDGTTSWPVTSLGIQNVGPFAFGAPISLILLHGTDSVCNISLGTFNFGGCPPVNDDCANATILTPGAVFNTNPLVGTNNFATASSGAPAPICAYYSGGDVWYQVTVPASGSLTIETNNNSSNITDTGLEVYAGTCGGFTSLGCNDDGSLDGAFSLVSVTGRTPGEVLYVRVWEYGNDSFGTFLVSAYDASLSSSTFDTNSFMAYPNPVKDVLNVSYSTEISSIRVINMIGQEVISKNINATSTQVDMSQLSSGTYIVNVTVGDNVKTLKVVKQ